MSENRIKTLYFCIGLLVSCLIFVILYFTVFYKEKTTMRKNSKYKDTLSWAVDFVNNKLYDSGYKLGVYDSIKNKDMIDIVKSQITQIYPTNNTPNNILNIVSFHFITIDTVKEFKQFYNYVGLNKYEETTMKYDPKYSEASAWAAIFKKKRIENKDYVLEDYDIKMRDITTDIVSNQINKIYPSNKIPKSLLKFISHNFIDISLVFIFREMYEKNGLHKIIL